MISTATLTGSQLRTYNTIFQHPVSHNQGWRRVLTRFRHFSAVVEERDGNLRVTRNGESHPELGGRIIGSLLVDENHLTDGQRLDDSRDFYSNPATLRP